MRMNLLILATIGSLAVVSASWAGARIAPIGDVSPTQLVAAKKLKPSMSIAKFKAAGANARSTVPQGCVYGNDNITRCDKICVESASGMMCADHNSCYGNNGLEIPCS